MSDTVTTADGGSHAQPPHSLVVHDHHKLDPTPLFGYCSSLFELISL